MGDARLRRRRRGGDAPPADPPASHKPSPARSDISDQKPPKTLPLRGAILPFPDHGHLLEVREPADLLFPPLLSLRPHPPREIHHEESAQCRLDRRRFAPLLAPLFRHQAHGSNRRARSTDKET